MTSVILDNEPDLGLNCCFYTRMGPAVMLDITHVNCLIGRFRVTPTRWSIVDRSGTVPRTLYSDVVA